MRGDRGGFVREGGERGGRDAGERGGFSNFQREDRAERGRGGFNRREGEEGNTRGGFNRRAEGEEGETTSSDFARRSDGDNIRGGARVERGGYRGVSERGSRGGFRNANIKE